jgi:hypothetical protein
MCSVLSWNHSYTFREFRVIIRLSMDFHAEKQTLKPLIVILVLDVITILAYLANTLKLKKCYSRLINNTECFCLRLPIDKKVENIQELVVFQKLEL